MRSTTGLVSCNESQASEKSVLKPEGRIIPPAKHGGEQSRAAEGNETKASETKCNEAWESNYPAKQGIIPRSELAIKFPKVALGLIPMIIFGLAYVEHQD